MNFHAYKLVYKVNAVSGHHEFVFECKNSLSTKSQSFKEWAFWFTLYFLNESHMIWLSLFVYDCVQYNFSVCTELSMIQFLLFVNDGVQYICFCLVKMLYDSISSVCFGRCTIHLFLSFCLEWYMYDTISCVYVFRMFYYTLFE